MHKNLNVFTMCWGDHYVDLFKRACFKSLNWPKNKQALLDAGAEWFVYTKKEHFAEFESIFKESGFKLNLLPVEESMRVAGCGMVRTQQCDGGVILLNGLRQMIYECLAKKRKFLLAPPDTLFGDGSVDHLLKCGSVPYSCVSVAHPRVLPSILDDIAYLGATRGSLSNAQLVTMAFKHAHDSWKYAEIGHEKNSSFIGGIAWSKLADGLYSVTHRLPTVYLADFVQSDWDFFWSQVSFGGWDHRWPAENLIRQERQRYIGSSDACFIMEVTEWDKNVPPTVDKNQIQGLSADAYWNQHYHNGINRQTSVIFRGE